MTAASGPTRFYVSLPVDEEGNSRYTPAVVEATAEALPGRTDYLRLRVVAPAEFARRWPTLQRSADGPDDWIEVEGPARMLSRAEYDSIITTMRH